MNAAPPPIAMRELGASALVGADRAGGGKDGARALLTSAAILGLKSRAGARPRSAGTPVPTCPEDGATVSSVAAGATLARLLANPDEDLINEWAGLARARGWRVPDGIAPVLLDWWARQPRRSEDVFAVLGVRGDWLAALNPAWRKPVARDEAPADAEDRWQTGTAAERGALLATVRRTQPGRALALVMKTWKEDGADERARFVQCLHTGASMDDEPFLEGALDDRSKGVRASAAAVLRRITGSRFNQRMSERVASIVRLAETRKGVIRKARREITVEPPEEFDPAWVRDGIDEKPPAGTGKRAWWMKQIFERAHPTAFTLGGALSFEDVARALAECDYAKDVVESFVEACQAVPDAAWNAPVLRTLLDAKAGTPGSFGFLCLGLEAEALERLVLEYIRHESTPWMERWSQLAMTDGPWSEAFSRSAVAALDASRPKKHAEWWQLSEHARQISARIHPGAAGEFEESLRASFKDVPESITRSIDRVRLRADMHKEFAT